MPKARIVQAINNMFEDEEYGFEAYAVMKDIPAMRRIVLFEGRPTRGTSGSQNSFKEEVKNSIVEYIQEEYLSEEAEYELAENIADNQRKFYVIEQDQSYLPFEMFTGDIDNNNMFSMALRDNVKGFAFMYRRGDFKIWGYQHLYAVTIPNKAKRNWLSVQDAEVFKEIDIPMLPIAKKINLLVIGNEIITKDISLMQRQFGFDLFVRNSAGKVVGDIGDLNIITNMDKLTTYIERNQLTYAKKMMRIRHSAVLRMPAEDLLNRVRTLPRWSGKFVIENNRIVLNTYTHVENLIDLLDERFTRSDVTGEEYSTDVKRIAPPIG